MHALSCYFLEALRAMSFPFSTAFIVSQRFGYVLPSFSLNSKKSLISSISSLTKLSLSIVQFPRVCGLSVVFVAIEDHFYSIVI